jgi:very-short-patch-repair endonuclease
MPSQHEERLALHIRAQRLPAPVREFLPIEGRRFRIDFAWPDRRIALEVQGGNWSGGRHTRAGALNAEYEKVNLLVLAGWRVLLVSPEHIQRGQALAWLRELLK